MYILHYCSKGTVKFSFYGTGGRFPFILRLIFEISERLLNIFV